MVKFASHRFKGIAGRSNNEYRISNVEGMYSVYFIKKIEQAYFTKLATKAKSETTLRYSAVHYSTVLRFAVQCLNPEP